MENQQPPLHQDEIEKLCSQNAELKKNLEREQALHSMLYKEWKELSEQAAAKEHEIYEKGRPKNLFYKYAFYVILIGLIPAYYFLYPGNKNGNTPASPQPAAVPAMVKDSASIKDSTPVSDVTQPAGKQPAVEQPAEKPIEKQVIQPDTSKPKMIAITKPVIETAVDSSERDSIYWLGWNAYFNKSRSHFRKSSQRFKIWLQGFNDGRVDARKQVAKQDSLKKRK